MKEIDAGLMGQSPLDFLGLAPFLRASIAGFDLRPMAIHMLQSVEIHQQHPNLLMNLAIALQCLNQQELGLAFQREALALQRSYRLPARTESTRLRLLVLVTPGSIQSNTPLDCLLEVSSVELIFHFVWPGEGSLADSPEHDALFVGISDSDANRALLGDLAVALDQWHRPVLNSPRHLPSTGRDAASRLLQGVRGLLVPATARVSRSQLHALAAGRSPVDDLLADRDFPVILRPLGSQGGADLQKMGSPADVAAYLNGVPAEEAFFMAPFMDYGDARGLFRKIRIALIDGAPFVCHMAVSSNWMIHYVNAGMYEEAWKRQEEANFMADFPAFVQRHGAALRAIAQRMQLDYLVMDCAETATGELLLFEIDHGGVVHAMDVESVFPYKNAHIAKAKAAFLTLLDRRMSADATCHPAPFHLETAHVIA